MLVQPYQKTSELQGSNEVLRIQTPEHVGFQYTLAGLGTRSTAFILDIIIRALMVLVLFVCLILLIKWLPAMDPTGFLDRLSTVWLFALAIFMYAVLDLGYFLLFEALWSGQTPGKRLQKIRAVQVNGQPIGWMESSVRNILRAIDLLGGVYPIGLLVMFFSARNQRIGDYVAGTIVVIEGKTQTPALRQEEMAPETAVGDVEIHISTMTYEEYRLIRSFLQRRDGMDDVHRSQLARTLGHRLMARWGMQPKKERTYESFLEEVVRAYERSKRAI